MTLFDVLCVIFWWSIIGQFVILPLFMASYDNCGFCRDHPVAGYFLIYFGIPTALGILAALLFGIFRFVDWSKTVTLF